MKSILPLLQFCYRGSLLGKGHRFSVPPEVATNTMNPVTFCGRTFRVQEVELMREIAQDYAGLGVTVSLRKVGLRIW